MLIELCNDIAKDARDGNQEAIRALYYIVMAYRLGKHLVFLPHDAVDTIQRSELPYELRQVFVAIGKQTSSIGAFCVSVSVKIVVTRGTYTPAANQKVIVFNPFENDNSFEIYEETHLLTENLQDAEFYKALVSYYKRIHKLNSISECFFPLQGGGDTIKKVMEKEIELGQHLCLAIVDSDKKYDTCKKGDTYKKLNDIIRRLSPRYCDMYCMELVREIENLIPYYLICGCSQYKGNRLVKEDFDFDMSFYDMKDGISRKNLDNEQFVSYWREALAVHHIEFSKIIKKEVKGKKKKKNRKKKIDEVLLPGFGSSLLEVIMRKSNGELMRIDKGCLSVSQQKEWENIGKIVFEWCCACKIRN